MKYLEFQKWYKPEESPRANELEALISEYQAKQRRRGRKISLFVALAELVEAGAKTLI